MRVLTIVGTRPEAIKMAPVLRHLAQRPAVESILCVTGQHRQMLDQVLGIFGIQPDIDLNLMRTGQHLGSLTAEAVEQLAAANRFEVIEASFWLPIGTVEAWQAAQTADVSPAR